ncbi:MAG: septum formation initiator family protein [Candidatus Omnitrophota bacterium]|nr:septum formation initiator family protein [Candidatus Omnitrophota bacterium]
MIKNGIWLFIFTIAVFLLFLPSYTQMQDLKTRNTDYAQEILNLKEENQRLKKERLLLETDPVYLEKIARQKMGLVKDGEVVARITTMPANEEENPR